MKCIECNNPAVFARYTQFSGTHYYCKEHAEQETDFMQDQMGYSYWGEVDDDTE